MNNSDRNPDAYDEIRDDRLGTNWPDAAPAVPCDICGEPAPAVSRATIFHTCKQDKVRARITELEAQLAAAGERERVLATLLQEACEVIGDLQEQQAMPDAFASLFVQRAAAALAAAQPASDGGEGE